MDHPEYDYVKGDRDDLVFIGQEHTTPPARCIGYLGDVFGSIACCVSISLYPRSSKFALMSVPVWRADFMILKSELLSI